MRFLAALVLERLAVPDVPEPRSSSTRCAPRAREVSFAEIASPYGHDAFLLEPEEQRRYIEPFLARALVEARAERAAEPRGGERR